MKKPEFLLRRTAAALASFTLAAAAAASPSAAATADESCRSARLAAAGKYTSSVLSCHAKAATTGAAIDDLCVAGAAGKLVAAWAAAETKNEVTCNGIDDAAMFYGGEAADAVDEAAPVPDGGGSCPSLVRKSAGKLASSILKAWSKFLKDGDATKRDEAIGKARTTSDTKIGKAEGKGDCASTGQATAVRTGVEDALAPLLACLSSSADCEESADTVDAGGSVTTDPEGSGPTEEEPVTAEVETPNEGTVVLRIVDGTAPFGYEVLGVGVEIEAPPATAAAPLVFTFTIDASLVPPVIADVTVTRDGVPVADCTGAAGVAEPDPCIQSRTVLPSGDLEIVALSSHASVWTPVLGASNNGCPMSMRWTTKADTTSGATSASELDLGWSGLGHDMDPAADFRTRFTLSCGAATEESCGVCQVTGYHPGDGNCRCASDTRQVCDTPLANDSTNCGGGACECYVRPPTPVHIGGTSVCLVGRAGSQASGSWDLDAGSGGVTIDERMRIYIGGSIQEPCPVCTGDATAGDGVRGGTCSGGPSDGLACDADSSDSRFPPPSGGAMSLDCLPSIGGNLTGSGLPLVRTESTGSVSMTASIPCPDSPSESCACAVCSGNTSLACSSDAECASASAGTCSSDAFGDTGANRCWDGVCTESGGEGICLAGPMDGYCNGIVDEDGRGVLACYDDTDCTFFDAGTCETEVRRCFAPTIARTGTASATDPTTVAAICLPPTANSAANTAIGLPGPLRLTTDWAVTLLP